MAIQIKSSIYSLLYSVSYFVLFAGSLFITPVDILAQSGTLEEIVVTAQRREQSLQDVPISIEAVSGQEVRKQGYRNMDDLANFSPTVLVNPNILRSSITIRGFGASTADALTIEQSSPTFVDGVHYSRTSQVKLGFMDVERVEVLKGPQPIYFGQNAIAGAFNITSRKPTPEWEAEADAEFGNFGKITSNFAAGGPINDTWGIRVAGQYDRSTGFMKDVISGDSFPQYENYGGRVILQWTPNERLQATAKFEMSKLNKGSEGGALCDNGAPTAGNIWQDSVYLEPPRGTGTTLPVATLPPCFEGNIGRSSDGPFFAPPNYILEDRNSLILDIRDAGDALFMKEYGFKMTDGFENLKPWTSYLDLQYELKGGVSINALTAFSHYFRETNRENRYSPYVTNIQARDENLDSFSQEIRVSSPSGPIEWMFGGYYSKLEQDGFADLLRGNVRTGRRLNRWTEDGEWYSAFGQLKFNFMDDKVSLDVGGRVTKVDKTTTIAGWVAQWIFDDGTPQGFSYAFNQAVTSGPVTSRTNSTSNPFNGARAIGLTPLQTNNSVGLAGPYDGVNGPAGVWKGTEFDPQVTLNYRPSEDTTFYARFAQAFKAGGADARIALTLPNTPAAFDEFVFEAEYGTNYELGVKGNFWEGSGRYDLSLFKSKITDLQVASTTNNPLDSSLVFGNAGKQEVKGAEFSADLAPTDRLTLGLGAALLDSVMADFISTCTEEEALNAEATGCNVPGPGKIDRSGRRAPNAPVWKFVFTMDYRMPVWDNYVALFNAKAYLSDGYLTDTTGFSKVNMMDTHGDLNLRAGLANSDETWQVSVYARNIFEARPTYHPEYDLTPEAVSGTTFYDSNFMSYGVIFEYKYN